ncbi:MAG TPA: MBL fold metallo-hydrolase [Rugosimonospora sp.]|nr:MBL fold metallo-hydrolase [Rugosimonospora sp.]
MHEVAENVFQVTGSHVNWALVRDGSDLTLIDGGYYRDYAAVRRSIHAIGSRPEDLRAILVTHAHVDHIGAASRLHEEYAIPVYASPLEVAHARREYLQQATVGDVLKRAWRPTVLRWSVRILRAGALHPVAIRAAQPHPTGAGPLDVPGHPVPIACPGHTSGHSAYHLPRAGVLVSGDALVTGHPLARFTGPQLLPAFFTHSQTDAIASLAVLGRLEADVLLPGHGQPWPGSIQTAVALAAEAATAGGRCA